MAETLRFIKPGALTVEYRRPREGPPNFLIWEPCKSYICLTPEQVLQQTKWGKGTETGIALRAWLADIANLKSPQLDSD